MYLLPLYIKKYKTNAEGQCFVRKIRANTVYQYNDDGYIRDYNPNGLLFRNEKDKGIFLKEQRGVKNRYGGGTTAVFINDSEKETTIITSISYFGWQQSVFLGLLLLGLLYTSLFSQKDTLFLIGAVVIFNLLFALTSEKALKRQKELVENAIESCVTEK
ncbi:MAG: hypothetical protein EP338_09985 [Bacteroidetes bacterium]|nr:MAG: hypothetical protein EP338_09985 [Bacteroidota bacterium]